MSYFLHTSTLLLVKLLVLLYLVGQNNDAVTLFTRQELMPAEIDTEEKKNSLFFTGNACAMQSQKFKETQPWFFLVLPFFFFSFALLWGGEFRGQPVI